MSNSYNYSLFKGLWDSNTEYYNLTFAEKGEESNTNDTSMVTVDSSIDTNDSSMVDGDSSIDTNDSLIIKDDLFDDTMVNDFVRAFRHSQYACNNSIFSLEDFDVVLETIKDVSKSKADKKKIAVNEKTKPVYLNFLYTFKNSIKIEKIKPTTGLDYFKLYKYNLEGNKQDFIFDIYLIDSQLNYKKRMVNDIEQYIKNAMEKIIVNYTTAQTMFGKLTDINELIVLIREFNDNFTYKLYGTYSEAFNYFNNIFTSNNIKSFNTLLQPRNILFYNKNEVDDICAIDLSNGKYYDYHTEPKFIISNVINNTISKTGDMAVFKNTLDSFNVQLYKMFGSNDDVINVSFFMRKLLQEKLRNQKSVYVLIGPSNGAKSYLVNYLQELIGDRNNNIILTLNNNAVTSDKNFELCKKTIMKHNKTAILCYIDDVATGKIMNDVIKYFSNSDDKNESLDTPPLLILADCFLNFTVDNGMNNRMKYLVTKGRFIDNPNPNNSNEFKKDDTMKNISLSPFERLGIMSYLLTNTHFADMERDGKSVQYYTHDQLPSVDKFVTSYLIADKGKQILKEEVVKEFQNYTKEFAFSNVLVEQMFTNSKIKFRDGYLKGYSFKNNNNNNNDKEDAKLNSLFEKIKLNNK